MKYIFTPDSRRAAPTTLLVSENKGVKLIPGANELPDEEWDSIKSLPAVQAMLESEVLRVLDAPAPAPSPSPKSK